MGPLDARKIHILQAVVSDYVLTTRPVGSERLIEIYRLGCKSATVRNEMAEMTEMGYLAQPHTSAGRIPTDRGYRYYVNELMDPPAALSPNEAQQAQTLHQKAQMEIEELILQTCRVLSGLTSYPSIATDPITETTVIRRVYLVGASPRHLLMVILLSTGHVEHRLVEVQTVPDDSALTQLSNYMNAAVSERDLDEVGRGSGAPEIPLELLAYAVLLTKLSAVLAQAAHTLSERRVYLEGASQFLRQPEFQDVQRLEMLLNALERGGALYQVLSRALQNEDVTAIIGMENDYTPMQECSIITTSYHIGPRTAGYLGVVGPTRMNYDRATAAVSLMGRHLSQMLTNLCLA